ncbi:hypothetical protein H632_c3302p0 [Helicosporidium sp. ATCC 50920]|nr:hypothetical protein H632_c3302p0 [Helicosporidium sp. ATCC 50920]|eukprot:KDD72470.1 hypothetical protein H632_c3302p0 [Helicosporidium sp. ATCC 50920]
MFVPGSEKYDINSFGFAYVVQKRETVFPAAIPNILLHFDYRCHVPGGKMGTNFPAGMADTIRWLGAATPGDIEQKYGFPFKYASVLQLRASSLVNLGFEEAIKSGAPINPPALRHDALEPCCNIVATAGASFCGDRYEPMLYNGTRLPWKVPPPNARPGRAPTPAMQARMRRLMSYHDPVTGGWTREDLEF